jgi:transposase
MPKKIDRAVKERAVRLVREHRSEYSSLTAAATAVARQERLGPETVPRWALQAEIDSGERTGSSSEEPAEIKTLKARVRRLEEDNAILKAARAPEHAHPGPAFPSRLEDPRRKRRDVPPQGGRDRSLPLPGHPHPDTMDEPNNNSGMSTWRAGCSGTGTSGSAGGSRKRTSRKADTAPRPDPTPTSGRGPGSSMSRSSSTVTRNGSLPGTPRQPKPPSWS